MVDERETQYSNSAITAQHCQIQVLTVLAIRSSSGTMPNTLSGHHCGQRASRMGFSTLKDVVFIISLFA